MEIVVGLILTFIGVATGIIGVIYQGASRTDRLLREIRDVLIQIRDK